MKELSIFIDESGDFGEYEAHAPYYIISMVFHDQSKDIYSAIEKLDQQLQYLNLHNLCIHTGPIIRREEIYHDMSIRERRTIFNKMMAFIRNIDVRYTCFVVDKRETDDAVAMISRLSKQISSFIKDHYEDLLGFDAIKVYYDNGQVEVTKMLASVLGAVLPGAEFRKVMPIDYKLFQAADLICTMELLHLKLQNMGLSHSENIFFGNTRDLKRNYLKPLEKKKWV